MPTPPKSQRGKSFEPISFTRGAPVSAWQVRRNAQYKLLKDIQAKSDSVQLCYEIILGTSVEHLKRHQYCEF
jgi:hypothetical protein